MKTLNDPSLQEIQGGVNEASCFTAALGVIGIVAGVALTPVTGGTSAMVAWTLVGGIAGGIGTGFSIGDCVS
ncbi:hypothetical protein [Fibrella forsythiae]|uniref:Bacteriocin n=1 Tax=Fibrella forsythiae TaxID=2817061 RepID=A0ABS3JJC8_9BACT|nr:hypothetical protein [Fibrella forsythiae]MBO0949531.1 hypothetical protein [Fibrella forsythiae]